MIETDKYYTISKNKVNNDRSYQNKIWKVIKQNNTTAKIIEVDEKGEFKKNCFFNERYITISEYDFSDATPLMNLSTKSKMKNIIYKC